jgi:hypothetical protein
MVDGLPVREGEMESAISRLADVAGSRPETGLAALKALAGAGRDWRGTVPCRSFRAPVDRSAIHLRLNASAKSSNWICLWPLPESAKNCSSRSRTWPEAR